MKRRNLILVLAMAILCLGTWAYTAGTDGEYLCDVDFVAGILGDPGWIILDGRTQAEYGAGHIPGAVNYGKPVHMVLLNPTDGRRLSDEKAARLLGKIGLDNNKGLIVYGNKGDYRPALELFPVYLGVKEFRFLDGGFDAWLKEAKRVQTASVTPVPAVFKPKVSKRKLYISTYEMIRISKDRPKGLTIIDCRPRAEYEGIDVPTIRGGRFPGAIHVGYERNLDLETDKMLPKEALREVYKDIPIKNTVILYGHKSSRTPFSYIALKKLGYRNVRIYEDGWIIYGARSDTKIEDETYQDRRPVLKHVEEVPNLKERIRILEEKVKELEPRK